MGVLHCDREGCTNVMCRRYSQYHGYICDSCFEELIATGAETHIPTFMNTCKIDKDIEDGASARYRAVFPLSDDPWENDDEP